MALKRSPYPATHRAPLDIRGLSIDAPLFLGNFPGDELMSHGSSV